MSFRTSLALNVAPLCLRLALASTFIWAGMNKVAFRTTVSDPQDIAQLIEWGQISPQSASIPGPIETPQLTPVPVEPEPVVPEVIPDNIEDLTPETSRPDEPVEETPPPVEDIPPEDPGAANPETEGDDAEPEDTGLEDTGPEDTEPVDGAALPVAYQGEPAPVDVKRVMSLALMLDHAANPGVDETGQALSPLWPAALAKGTLPVVIAWVAGILELVCGAAVLIGFFTRLAALPLAGTMLTAMWLTQIGPAIQHGTAVYGFLPAGMFEMGANGYVYTEILWQFALLMAALAMFLIGPGALSVDRLIFGGPSSRLENSSGKRQVEFVPMGE